MDRGGRIVPQPDQRLHLGIELRVGRRKQDLFEFFHPEHSNTRDSTLHSSHPAPDPTSHRSGERLSGFSPVPHRTLDLLVGDRLEGVEVRLAERLEGIDWSAVAHRTGVIDVTSARAL